jgi:fructose-1,6-bisphosphatase I
VNVQGEKIQKLDMFANEEFAKAIQKGMHCAGIASEEIADLVAFNDAVSKNSKYVCMFDPLDGSSNIDVNVSVGSIFGIYRRITEPGNLVGPKDFLQAGTNQVAAAYICYGSCTILIYATSNGVNGFTLDYSVNDFYLSHPHIRCPENGEIYSVNQANFFHFSDQVKKYITKCQKKRCPAGDAYTQRYTGSLVADVHRNLMKGGIFIYPATSSHKQGKLRLLYECNPLAYVIERAGGVATDGTQKILEKIPKQLHERSPIFIGSRDMVEELLQ